MQGAVRQIAVCRAGNIHRRQVKIVSAAGGKGNTGTWRVELTVASEPHEVAACISVRAGQTIGCGSGKCTAVFHDDLNILGAITQLATV